MRLDLEKELAAALDRRFGNNETPPNLVEAIRYSLLAPGKRIRPRLLFACSALLDLDLRAALPAALAIEMFHCFTLIHDDLPCMDNDDFRRGRPSNHKVFGESLALLAGDALLALSIETFVESAAHLDSGLFQDGLRRFLWATGPRGVAGGQAAEALLNSQSTLTDLKKMHTLKTGVLFSAALLVPKDFAGILDTSSCGRSLIQFSEALGLAFQIVDDLEDAEKESARPTSILFYQNAEKTRTETRDILYKAQSELKEAWGDEKTRPLLLISEEVLDRMILIK